MKGAQYCDFRYRCQLQLGQQLVARTREAGRRVQFECTWRVGDPLPFGLYQIGDSAMRRTRSSARQARKRSVKHTRIIVTHYGGPDAL
jgi:hypothetical protein